jgi:hypothetical protein
MTSSNKTTIHCVAGTLEIANRGTSSKISDLFYRYLGFCDACAGMKKYFDVGRCPQIIAWYAFAVKPFFKLLNDVRHMYVHECLILQFCHFNLARSSFTGCCRF